MSKVHIIKPEQWRAYRSVRLAALQDSPDAFGSTYEDAIIYSDELWQGRLRDADPTRDLPMTIVDGGNFVALGWARIEQPKSLLAHLFSMWVAPQQRGRGYGRLLVEAAVDWARQQGMQTLELDVTCGNVRAEALYRSMGFIVVAEPMPLRPGSALLEQTLRLSL